MKRICLKCPENGPQPWSNFYAAKKWPDGSMRSPQSYCKRCRQKMANDWQKAHPEWRKAWDRERYARLSRDPEWMGERRAINRESQRRRFNRKPRRKSHAPSGAVVPAAPFTEWLRGVRERDGLEIRELANRCKVDYDLIRKHYHGQFQNVSLATVEAAIINEGTATLRDVYPTLYQEAA